jgi:rod shape-determining protein MreD
MQETPHAPFVSILLVFLFSLLLEIVPVPDWTLGYRIPWCGLALIYWCLAAPQQVGVFSGWLLGLTQDAITGTMLGQHALAHSLTAFICLQMYKRIRVFPVWQQSVIVMALLLMERLIDFWIISSTGHLPTSLMFWLPVLVGSLLWPLVHLIPGSQRRLSNLG